LLQFQLRERFPDTQVFIDLDSIEGGLPFADVIQEAVGSCAVLVALIGRQWVTLADEEGNRRLDNPGDFVRFEVQTALQRGVRVIPVLVDGARPLQQQQLPSELQQLAGLHALELSYGRYEYDAGRLFDLIRRVLAARRDLVDGGRQTPEDADRQVLEGAGRAVLEGPADAAAEAADAAGARDLFAALLPVRERELGPEHPDILATRANLAYWTGKAGDAAGARDQLAALLPVVRRVLGVEHKVTLTTRATLAAWTGHAGDEAGARDQFAALLPVQEQVLGPEHPDALLTRFNMAIHTTAAGDVAEARDEFAALLPVVRRVFGVEHKVTLVIRGFLANCTGVEDAKRACDQLAELLPVVRRVFGKKDPFTILIRRSRRHWAWQYALERGLKQM
jgi:hypothetical protein